MLIQQSLATADRLWCFAAIQAGDVRQKLQLLRRKITVSAVNLTVGVACINIQRAHIPLKSADGRTDADISQWLYISESTVRRTRLRFCDAGIDAALEDEAPSEREPLLNEQQEGRLVALTCSAPPDGGERWTLELLTERLIADGVVDSIWVESVRLLLQKTSQTLASTSVVYSKSNAAIYRADGSDPDFVCSAL